MLPERDHRLLHPRDRRLAARTALPRRRSDPVVERAAAEHGIEPGELVLGSDNGSAFTARRFRETLGGLGIRHRRGGYRDPESQAFIESWFGKLKEREVWLNEYETLDHARQGIAGYVDRYHHRPHSGLGYRTPDEVRRTWEDHRDYKNKRPSLSTPAGSRSVSSITHLHKLDKARMPPRGLGELTSLRACSQAQQSGTPARPTRQTRLGLIRHQEQIGVTGDRPSSPIFIHPRPPHRGQLN